MYLYVHWRERTEKVKMEFIDSVLYQVIAKYMEIDGREYVMEMINCLDDELILDPQGQKPSAEKISGYQELCIQMPLQVHPIGISMRI